MTNTMGTARLSLILVLSILTTIAWANTTSRIIGGEDVTTSAASYAASVRLDNAHICGGSIIGLHYILTAAHCVVDSSTSKVFDNSRLSVRVGSTNQFAGGAMHYIQNITPHPEYSATFKNDIAILKLTEPVVIGPKTTIIELGNQPAAGASVIVAGWGQQSVVPGDSPYKLQHKTFTVATEEDCRNANELVDDSNICLAHELRNGNCKGDAGNGAVYDNKLVGVCSFVVGACGSIYPDVFIGVQNYISWIQDVIASGGN